MAEQPQAQHPLGHVRWRMMAGPLSAILVAGPLATQYALLAVDFPGSSARVFLIAAALAMPLTSALVTLRTFRLAPVLLALHRRGALAASRAGASSSAVGAGASSPPVAPEGSSGASAPEPTSPAVGAEASSPGVSAAAASGSGKPGAKELIAALRELELLPSRLFRHTFQHFVVAGVFVDLFLLVFAREATTGTLVRLLALAVLLSPMLGFLTSCAASAATRPLVRRLAALGLTPRQVYDARPAKQQRLRMWIVLTTTTFALTTALMALDASFHAADRDMEHLLAERDPARQQLLAQQLEDRPLWPVVLLAAFGAGVGVATSLVVGRSITDPMERIAAQAARISKGEVAAPELIPADEEVWRLSSTFATIQEQLGDALAQLQGAGLRLGSSSTQLLDTFARQEEGATEQASALNETSATTEELARSAGQIAENAGEVEKMAERTLAAATTGQKSAEAFFASMLRMRNDNQAVADAVVKLNKRVAQIGRIVEFIDGIADKSDLLALNAELEGTKAGEVGRGFSLVAAEMRRLAENVMRSTREIEGLIQEIRDATNAAVMATEAGVKATERGTSSANQVQESLREIFELARETAGSVRQISLATHQQQTGTHQLADAMSDILRITEASSVATRQMRSANVDLTTLASELKVAVQQFTVMRQDSHGK